MTELKQLASYKFKIYLTKLTRGYTPKVSDYCPIKESMMAINFMENNDLDYYLREATFDFYITKLNKI